MEPEIGQVEFFRGKPYVYKGGDPGDRNSWEDASSPPTAKSSNAVKDLARAAAQGATQGFGDEIAGIIAGVLPGGKNRAEATEASSDRVEQIREDRPVGSFLAEVVGGAILPGGVGVNVGRRALQATGSRILAGGAGAAAGGAAGGAAQGAGEAEGGLLNRLGGAAIGGGVGTAAGGLLGSAGGAVTRGVNRIAGGDATTAAAVRIRRALQEAGIIPTPEGVRGAMADLPEGSVVADLGPNLARSARAARNEVAALDAPDGPVGRIRGRAEDTRERVASNLREASGLTNTFEESLDLANKARREVSEKFYRPLEEAFPTVEGLNIAGALQDPRVAAVAKRVGVEGQAPSFKQIQSIRGHLSDEASAARVAGKPFEREQAENALRLLDSALEVDVPGYKEASNAWRIASRRIDGHELGRKMATKTSREIRGEMEKLPPEAHDAFRQGLLDKWEMALLDRTGAGGKAGSIIDAGPEGLARLRTIVKDDEGMQKLLSGIERESRWRTLHQTLSGNSTTAMQASDQLSMSDIPTQRREAMMQLAAKLTGLSPQERRTMWEKIGEVLLSSGEEAAHILADELMVTGGGPVAGAAGVAGTAAAQGLLR